MSSLGKYAEQVSSITDTIYNEKVKNHKHDKTYKRADRNHIIQFYHLIRIFVLEAVKNPLPPIFMGEGHRRVDFVRDRDPPMCATTIVMSGRIASPGMLLEGE